MIDHYLLFTDGSVNTKRKIGYGSFLLLNKTDLASSELDIRTKRFQNTTSTKLELETLLWALVTIDIRNVKLSVFTDSNLIMGLNDRRANLEKNNFYSATNKRLNNHLLYRDFYMMFDQMDFKLFKVKGHSKSSEKDRYDKLFSIVDKASRKALRNESKS